MRAALFASRALLLALLVSAASAAPKLPAWLDAARAVKTPSFGAGTTAVVLLDEQRAVVDGKGKTTYYVRYAVRVLSSAGRGAATARIMYRTDTGRVKALSAWLVTPSGTVKEYGKKETVDISLSDNDVYNESRVRVIAASSEAIAGSVFGFEGESEDKSIFTQHEWLFQGRNPVMRSSFTLQLPDGWRAEAKSYNHPEIAAKVSGGSYLWELADLPPIEREEAGPGISGLAPRIAVSYFPPQGTAADAPAFASWGDVSRWLSGFYEPQSNSDAALKAKVAELTASAATEREKIEAIGQFAQRVKYVSIQVGVGRGGGYRPRAATEVLAKLYGDCKDKSTLMRAMLREAGIESYPVAIFSGDPTYVREDWPSPQQFNHAIIAVKVSPDLDAPAVREYPSLGRLLFFDPTDEYTPVGYLPDHEQGSFALVVLPENGELVEAPKPPAEANHLARNIKAELREDGSLVATVEEHCSGQTASFNRRLYRRVNESDYRRIIERWVAGGVPGSNVRKIEAADESPHFLLDVELTAPTYGQIMGGRLWMFKPSLIERRNWYGLQQEKRKHPFLLDPDSYEETVEILLPKGFKVDEMPAAMELENEFGSFNASWEHGDGILVFKRSFRTEGGAIPAERYPELRSFLRNVDAATQAAVVLERQ